MDEIRHVQVTDESLIKWSSKLKKHEKITIGGINSSALELYLNWLKMMGWNLKAITLSVNQIEYIRSWDIIISNENVLDYFKSPFPNDSFRPNNIG